MGVQDRALKLYPDAGLTATECTVTTFCKQYYCSDNCLIWKGPKGGLWSTSRNWLISDRNNLTLSTDTPIASENPYLPLGKIFDWHFFFSFLLKIVVKVSLLKKSHIKTFVDDALCVWNADMGISWTTHCASSEAERVKIVQIIKTSPLLEKFFSVHVAYDSQVSCSSLDLWHFYFMKDLWVLLLWSLGTHTCAPVDEYILSHSMHISFFLSFFLWVGTQNGHNVPFLKSASFKKRKRKVIKSYRLSFRKQNQVRLWTG